MLICYVIASVKKTFRYFAYLLISHNSYDLFRPTYMFITIIEESKTYISAKQIFK